MRSASIGARLHLFAAGCALTMVQAALWAQAQPLTVEQAVQEAIQNNPGLIAERANITIAEAQILTARLRPNPVVSAGADHLDVLGTGFSEDNGGGPAEYSLRTDFTLETGGKRRARTEVAQKSRSVAEMDFQNAVRLVALDVENAAVDALLAAENLALARENRISAERIVEINTARLNSGDIVEVELIRSRVAALQHSNAERRAELAARSAMNKLRVLLGRGRESSAIAIAGGLRRDPSVRGLDEWIENAMMSRPDVLALQRDLERASAEVRLQQAQAKVDYTVGAEYRRQQGVNGKSNSVGVFFSAGLPVFNRNQGEIERARRAERQCEARLKALEAEVRAEVTGAFDEFEASMNLLETIEKRLLSEAREVREVTQYSYEQGEATLLELLDAQRTFNETMQAYNEARAEHARSLYRLDAASGRGVNP
jgi:cobalt-zinc-cadmium efflux system outer membrane protein